MRTKTSAILFVCVILTGCAALSGGALPPGSGTGSPGFDKHEIELGPARGHAILTGRFFENSFADIAVVSMEARGQSRLRIYEFINGYWISRTDVRMRIGVTFVDVATIGGHDRLITFESGRLNRFDPEALTEVELAMVPFTITPPRTDMVPHVDITRDVNGDGRDDLVLPGSCGFRILIQRPDGTFTEPVKIGPTFDMGRLKGFAHSRFDPWSRARIHEIDYNRDGRSDLAYWNGGHFWNRDHFKVHLQDTDGNFGRPAETFTADVAFDSDDIFTLAAPDGIRRRRLDHNPEGALTGRVLHSMADLNGDGIADLGVFELKGGTLIKMHSSYEVYFGSPAPGGGTQFASEVGTAIHSDGLLLGMETHDIDDDGQVEMSFSTINPGVFKVVGMLVHAVLFGSVSIDYHLYQMEGGRFPDRPNTARKIYTTAFGESGEQASQKPAVLFGHVNGDRLADLVVQKGLKELHVHHGVPRPGLFARRPVKVPVAMPAGEDYTWLVDLNNDDSQDVIIYNPSDSGPHRLTVLIAR